MTSIKLKVTILTITLALGAGYSIYFAQINYKQYKIISETILKSFETQRILDQLSSRPYTTKQFRDLQNLRASLTPKERQSAFSHVIQAYSSSNQRLLQIRAKDFMEAESNFVTSLKNKKIYLEEKYEFYMHTAAAIVVCGLLMLLTLIYSRVFTPLDRLNRQMLAFIGGQYSYQFTVPTPDEVGHLQSTFNSMAQTVLRNMDELKALDVAKSEFLNIASHELRTPMTSIKGSLGLVTSGVMGSLNPEVLNLMNIAEAETDRLIRLINDILDMAKIEAKRLPLKQTWFSIHELFKQTQSGLHGLAETSKVQIEVHESSFWVFADRDRIQQVLTNLLSNALKFSPPGGVVSVATRMTTEGSLAIEVVDQGRGISPEDQAHIFQKFRQATNSESPLVKGTGLGLAIAKALIEEHEGEIGVHSTPGRGSTFFFTLPKVQNQKGAEEIRINNNVNLRLVSLDPLTQGQVA